MEIVDNDTDDDGVCDELDEVVGCTVEWADNYNPFATLA